MPATANWRRHFDLSRTTQRLLTQAQFSDQVAVTVCVFVLQVGQQGLTTVNHLDQATAGVVILGVLLEVAVQLVDASGQQCNLHFWGAGVVLATGVIRDDGGFVDAFYGHDITFHMRCAESEPCPP